MKGLVIFNGAIDFGLVVDGSVVLVETLIASFYSLSIEERAKKRLLIIIPLTLALIVFIPWREFILMLIMSIRLLGPCRCDHDDINEHHLHS